MPEVSDKEGFKPLMGLSQVHILPIVKDDIAYVGFEFGCTWDDEHGLGVLTHKNRVVEIGGADTSFIGWNAKNDGGLSQKLERIAASSEPAKQEEPLPETQPELPFDS